MNRIIVGVSDVVLLAQGGDDADKTNLIQSFAPMVAIGIFFYFIVMRPQLKSQKNKRKQHEDLMTNLKKNDKVVTIGGIIGTVAEVADDRVTLKIDDNTRVKFTRSSIQDLLSDRKEADKKEIGT
ncbi:MAG: preprotein translocase subunit YajC [Planctomycetaceae bacterium]